MVLALLAGEAHALNCVEYVRRVSGMDVSGDGWQWWENSNGRYEHGHAPKEGAVLVFDRTPTMEHGHVALVTKQLDARLITITHANWSHYHSLKGHVSSGVMVQDVSDHNDWTEVKVWDEASQSFGRSNRILGFVYNKPGAATMVAQNMIDQNMIDQNLGGQNAGGRNAGGRNAIGRDTPDEEPARAGAETTVRDIDNE